MDSEKVNENQLDCTPSNQEVLDMVDEDRSLMNTIRQREKNWLGHEVNPFCVQS